MKIIKPGKHSQSPESLGCRIGVHTCRECGCVFELTRQDSVHSSGGDWFVNCPECKAEILVSND